MARFRISTILLTLATFALAACGSPTAPEPTPTPDAGVYAGSSTKTKEDP